MISSRGNCENPFYFSDSCPILPQSLGDDDDEEVAEENGNDEEEEDEDDVEEDEEEDARENERSAEIGERSNPHAEDDFQREFADVEDEEDEDEEDRNDEDLEESDGQDEDGDEEDEEEANEDDDDDDDLDPMSSHHDVDEVGHNVFGALIGGGVVGGGRGRSRGAETENDIDEESRSGENDIDDSLLMQITRSGMVGA